MKFDNDLNINVNRKLGFGQYRDVPINELDSEQCNYLIWALNTFRLPKPLYDAIIAHFDSMVIMESKYCLGKIDEIDPKDFGLDKEDLILDLSLFLAPRIKPDYHYTCKSCGSINKGRTNKVENHDKIFCFDCNNHIEVSDDELKFYFGWYKGWRIIDFKTKEDRQYLRWIIKNVDRLSDRFTNAIKTYLQRFVIDSY